MRDLIGMITKFLEKNIIASTRRISKELNISYNVVNHTLSRMYVQGKVGTVKRKEKFPGGLTYLEVRYWYLKKNEDRVKEILKEWGD